MMRCGQQSLFIRMLSAAIFILCFSLLPSGNAAVLELKSSSSISTTGFYTLSWNNNLEQVELQESQDASFTEPRILYKGADSATVLSGKSDGKRFYRIRITSAEKMGEWSSPMVVEVSHHSLGKGLAFFAVGLLIFISIVLMIILSSRSARQ